MREGVTKQGSPMLAGKQVAVVLDRTGITRITKLLVVVASLGYLFDAFDTTLIGYVMPLISKNFVINATSEGLLLSLSLWGGLLGMWFWGPVSEAKGRRFGFQGTVLSYTLFTGLAALAWSPLSFGAACFIAGAGLAGLYAVDLGMVSEMTPTRVRGRLTSLITMTYPVGVILAGVVTALLAQEIGWRGMFLVGVAPGFIAYLLSRRVPESPRWLASKGRTADAIRSLLSLGAKQETINEARYSECEGAVETSAELDKGLVREKFIELFSRKWLTANIVAWSLWISASFAAWGVGLWLPTILVDVYHFTFVKGVMFTVLYWVFALLGRMCGVLLIDKIGRKFLIAGSSIAAALACVAIGVARVPFLLLIFIMIFKFCDQQANVGTMGYIPELYPTRLRVMGGACAGSAGRIAGALAPMLVGVILGTHHYITIWIIFAAVYVVSVLVISFMGLETKDKTLEECTQSV